MISNLKDFDALEKIFKDENLELNGTKVIVDPDFKNIGDDIGQFLNKFQSWFFLSKVARIDFSNWDWFMIIKKKTIKDNRTVSRTEGIKPKLL